MKRSFLWLLIGGWCKNQNRKQKKKGGFRTKGDAKEAAALIVTELSQGTYSEESNTTFESFSTMWLKGYEGTGKVKASTVRRLHEISRLLPFFAQLKMKDISRKRYQEALNDLKSKGFADNTLDGIHRTGRMIFKKAVEFDEIKIDPTQYASISKIQKTVEELEEEETAIKYLEKEELARFLLVAKEQGLERDHIIFTTLAYTGMRVGELCALKWKDIEVLRIECAEF